MVLNNVEKLSKNKILAFILLFIVVFQSGHAFQIIIPQLSNTIYLPAVIGLLFILFDRSCYNIRKPQNAMLWILILMILFTAIVDLGSSLTFYIQLIATVLAAYCIASLYSFEVMTKCYLTIMTVVSVVALVGYILLHNTSVLEMLPKLENINGVEYGVGIIFNYIVDIPERNCGMFWEPGLFATHLTIATVFELVTKEKASALRLILFTACIFTANSSAGFVLWFLCVALLLIRKKSEKYNLIKNVFSIVILIAVIVVALNFDTILAQTGLGENEYFQKLSSENVADSSRSNAITHNLEIFATDPIFGAGYNTVMQNIDHVADTSTSTFLMSIFGVLGISYTVFIVYGIMRIKRFSLFSRAVMLAILIVIVNKEPHHMIFFTWVLMFYLMKGFEKDKIESIKLEKEIYSGEEYEYKKLS